MTGEVGTEGVKCQRLEGLSATTSKGHSEQVDRKESSHKRPINNECQ